MSSQRSRQTSQRSDSGAPLNTKRPKIGVTVSSRRGLEYYKPYLRAVEAAGGVPVELMAGSDTLPPLDGLLLPGGWDVDPALYGEEPDPAVGPIDRELDDTELSLFRQARERDLPVLGLCRGQQVINVAMGGKLYQHLEGHDVRGHGRSHIAHTIEVEPESELGRAAGQRSIPVNSFHHQAVRSLAPGLKQTARGEDGTIEGVESDDGLIVAVQCHPEELTGDLPWARTLFARFIARAGSQLKKR